MFVGTVIGTGLLFGLTWLLLYMNKRGIRTHPSEKRESRFKQRGRAKAEKKRSKRRYRF
jgi:hypothetical protein